MGVDEGIICIDSSLEGRNPWVEPVRSTLPSRCRQPFEDVGLDMGQAGAAVEETRGRVAVTLGGKWIGIGNYDG